MSEKIISICDVGLRDGLQGEGTILSLDQKFRLLELLCRAGVQYIEIGSFVRADIVPQMATTFELAVQSAIQKSIKRNVLIFNAKGLDQAIESKVSGVCIVSIISETLAQKNTGKGSKVLHGKVQSLIQSARSAGLNVRVDLAPAWICPFEGIIDSDNILDWSGEYLESGADELALADTIGHADPGMVGRLCADFVGRYGNQKLGVHLHDTQGLGLANAYAALTEGVRIFDSSFGGLGGCPFAPGAAGNLATEDLVFMAQRLGYSTGIQLERLWEVIELAEQMLGVKLGGRTHSWWKSGKVAASERIGECFRSSHGEPL